MATYIATCGYYSRINGLNDAFLTVRWMGAKTLTSGKLNKFSLFVILTCRFGEGKI